MAGTFTKRIWQPYICQPNELKREIKKKAEGVKQGAKQKSGGTMAHPGPPLESPLQRAANRKLLRYVETSMKEYQTHFQFRQATAPPCHQE